MVGVAHKLRALMVAMLPAGCLTWAHLRTDISRLIAESWMDVAEASAAGNRATYAAALNQCVAVYLRVAKVYEAESARMSGRGAAVGCPERGKG
jgi:hypothetical protein